MGVTHAEGHVLSHYIFRNGINSRRESSIRDDFFVCSDCMNKLNTFVLLDKISGLYQEEIQCKLLTKF